MPLPDRLLDLYAEHADNIEHALGILPKRYEDDAADILHGLISGLSWAHLSARRAAEGFEFTVHHGLVVGWDPFEPYLRWRSIISTMFQALQTDRPGLVIISYTLRTTAPSPASLIADLGQYSVRAGTEYDREQQQAFAWAFTQ